MDGFEFFFSFYGLILGLGATEVLSGIAAFARARPLREMRAQTALLALLVFVGISTTWIDAWRVRDTFSIDMGGLVVPLMIATSYYLAAATVFPRDEAESETLDGYYARGKRFTVAMLILAEIGVTITYLPAFARAFETQPAVFWLYHLPYNVLLKACLVALYFVRGRRANLALLVAMLVLLIIPYWGGGWIGAALARSFGYPPL